MSPSVSAAAMRPVAAPLRSFIARSSSIQTTLLQRCAISTTALRRSDNSTPGELQVGELQGATFRVEPLRRVGEDDATKRARLLCMFTKKPLSIASEIQKPQTNYDSLKTSLGSAEPSSRIFSSPPLPLKTSRQ